MFEKGEAKGEEESAKNKQTRRRREEHVGRDGQMRGRQWACDVWSRHGNALGEFNGFPGQTQRKRTGMQTWSRKKGNNRFMRWKITNLP